MDYSKIELISLLIPCFGIPAFFISATGIDGSNFKMTLISWACLAISITSATICILCVKQQNRREVKEN